jgi:hypothetical protein
MRAVGIEPTKALSRSLASIASMFAYFITPAQKGIPAQNRACAGIFRDFPLTGGGGMGYKGKYIPSVVGILM